ncbi:hypothetical protein R0011_11608 [Lacticaseibacillus rhamnosus R0011]|uniref:Uncharacterized protein n=1 Tax=Lacticaseibacillus rhamnosus LRHMDP3 TaxID=1203259 RepID=A0AB33XTE5_LACRH|nr:Hypothetical protein LOCK900_1897 [Lacticaseibacillus rhamnosus LOCK900]EHJ21217.1 hypothetical protein R0011_11608 [Lacticaseibacillus rhamnosus R0011]EKS49563.1 hypothetical protein LRHMDP2_2331 [Lacticaseibacillus rhamnosus LRHMDP2]EKS50129.1 hypothetical protein LRHMDP3_1953 [Lacticaseibacillus rhamnosus LRHMDP3]
MFKFMSEKEVHMFNLKQFQMNAKLTLFKNVPIVHLWYKVASL